MQRARRLPCRASRYGNVITGDNMYINTKGLVLRSVTYKDSSRILTVLTSEEGKLTVSARGSMRRGSKLAAAVQPLAYSNMTLLSSRDRWTLTEAQTIELFEGLSDDLELLALGSYFSELMEAVSDEDSPNPELLQLGLNALFLLSENEKDRRLIKAAFEMRLMRLAGYEPAVLECAVCSNTEMRLPVLDLAGGSVLCSTCKQAVGETSELCAASLDALRFILRSEPKKVFSFKLPDNALERLSRTAERYVSTQLDRGFKTLDYYKSIKM